MAINRHDTAVNLPIATAPRALPLLGHLIPLLHDMLGFLRSLPTHGDLVRVGIGPLSAVVVCDPELTRHLLRHDRIFDKGGPIFERGRESTGDGLAMCPHSLHRRLRRLLQPAFHPARVAGYAPVMSRRIMQITGSWHDGQIVDVQAQMHTLTSMVTTATLFTHSVPEPTLRRALHDLEVIVDGAMRRVLMPAPLLRLPILGNRAYRRAITDLRATLTPLLAARRAEGVDRGDLLSALVCARAGNGSGLSDTEICDQIVMFFLAGTETTATALAWAWYLLDRHPQVAEQLHAEVDAVLGGRPATYDDLPHLQLTGRIVAETLRLRPPTWFLTRVVSEDTTLGDHPLKAGTIMVYSPYLIHHRADLYPDPERFDPDRWVPATKSPPPRDALFPFADGARKCIGDTFAVTEMTLALATIATRWQLRTVTGREIGPALSVTLRPRHLRMRVAARASSSGPQTQHA